MTTSRLSGIQKDVLSLYRRILREAARKDRNEAGEEIPFTTLLRTTSGDSASSPPGRTLSYAAEEFRRQATSTRRSDFKKIEYLLRRGDKQLKLLQMPGVKVVRGTTHHD
jgi:succinate dehydrogenase assembly factor 1